MINRRSLRIKAFKNLYSYESCKGANYLMGLDLIDKEFSPDLNSMEMVDQEDLDRKKELAIEAFSTHFEKDVKDSPTNEEVESEVVDALEFVDRQNKTDFNRLSKDLLGESEKITKDQILILSLLEEMAFLNKKLADEKKSLAVVFFTQKKAVNLGLGINSGIRRFKEKWGGAPFLKYSSVFVDKREVDLGRLAKKL